MLKLQNKGIEKKTTSLNTDEKPEIKKIKKLLGNKIAVDIRLRKR